MFVSVCFELINPTTYYTWKDYCVKVIYTTCVKLYFVLACGLPYN